MQIEHNNITWKNMSNPGFQDLNFLDEKLSVSQVVLKDLLGFNKRPKIEEFDHYLFLVIHFPVFNEKTRQTTPTEIDFIVTQDMVLTVYQNENPVLVNLFEELNANEARRPECFKNAGWLLFYILDKMIDSCLPMLDHIHEKIDTIEEKVFDGQEKAMLKEIAIVKRDIIDFRRTIKPQRSVLELLSRKMSRFFKEDLEIISQEVVGSEIRVWNTLENHKEMIEAIEQTNSNLLSFQINQVMHTLTFFSIVLFSLTFIAGFFSMKAMEAIEKPFGLLGIGGLMITTVVFITVAFKNKRWL